MFFLGGELLEPVSAVVCIAGEVQSRLEKAYQGCAYSPEVLASKSVAWLRSLCLQRAGQGFSNLQAPLQTCPIF